MKPGDYEFYKSLGICTRCGKLPADPGAVMCLECKDKDAEYHAKSRAKYIDVRRSRDRDKARECKAKGICTRCKTRPAISGLTMCPKCRAYAKRYRDRKRGDLARSEWSAYGICYTCGKNPVFEDHKVCKECYEIRIRSINECIAKRDPDSNAYFRGLNDAHYAEQKSRKTPKNGIFSA